ncbi:MAG: outer membrane beta-barrel protein [Bacteroidetes bacterium]|nr:outer membrane beta-barrel protein [Bacteroidota bacterium]
MRKWYSAFLLFALATQLYAQETCTEKLVNANDLYDQGQFTEAMNLANGCTTSDKPADQWQAYRILSLSYLALNQMQEARESAINLLNIYPGYKSNSFNDPVEFTKLLSTITVIPKFSIGLGLTGSPFSAAIPRVSKSYVLGNYEKNYSVKNAFQFGFPFSYYLNPNIAINASLLASVNNFGIDYTPDNWKVSVTEQMTYLNLPLRLHYFLKPTSRLRYFLSAGAYAGYLLYDKNTFKAEDTYNREKREKYELTRLNILERRNRINYGATVGIGLDYKIFSNARINLQYNYYRSFRQINKPETRYDNIDQMYVYYYVDDDITVHNAVVSIGYSYFPSYRVFSKSK